MIRISIATTAARVATIGLSRVRGDYFPHGTDINVLNLENPLLRGRHAARGPFITIENTKHHYKEDAMQTRSVTARLFVLCSLRFSDLLSI